MIVAIIAVPSVDDPWLVEFLIDLGADPNKYWTMGRRPLELAFERPKLREALVRRGATESSAFERSVKNSKEAVRDLAEFLRHGGRVH